jgi:hypothetical protein
MQLVNEVSNKPKNRPRIEEIFCPFGVRSVLSSVYVTNAIARGSRSGEELCRAPHGVRLRKLENCVFRRDRVNLRIMRSANLRRVGPVIAASMVIASFLFSTGCGSTPQVTSWTNPVTGRRTDVMGDNLLDAPGETREMLWLNAYREVLSPQKQLFHLQVIYGARQEAGYLEINPGRSLSILVDGHELSFSGLGSLDRDERKGALFETARYDATADDISRIASASKVVVRVTGRHGIVVREFGPENHENFRKFAQQTGADL